MKRWKKLLLIVLVAALLSQIPFAYRRYRLGRLHSAIQQLNEQRVINRAASRDGVTQASADFVEYKGVIHVHSFLGGHSTGNFEEIIAGAKSNQLNFVVMTEHTSENFNTAAMTLKGMHSGILFINGNEVSTSNSDRLLIIPGDESEDASSRQSTQEVISKAKAQGLLTFVTYPQEFKRWEASGYDGVEIYNVYTDARRINPLLMFFDGLWSYRAYPDLLFANFYRRPNENLKKWDELAWTTGRKLVAIAGNDAHSNIGLSLNSESGQTILAVKLDPYERSFRLVRVHVLVPKDKPLDSASLLAAIAAGHCFIGFDLLADTSGFSFSASNGSENRIQGDEIQLGKEVRLKVQLFLDSRVVLLKDGKPIQDETGIRNKEYAVNEKGSYRVEVYLPQLPKPAGDQPWIISNPIYVR
jgi:hypothetical protein